MISLASKKVYSIWFHKVAMEFLMGTAVVNALLLFNEHCCKIGKSKSQLKIASFREHLVMWLLKTQPGRSSTGDRSSTDALVVTAGWFPRLGEVWLNSNPSVS